MSEKQVCNKLFVSLYPQNKSVWPVFFLSSFFTPALKTLNLITISKRNDFQLMGEINNMLHCCLSKNKQRWQTHYVMFNVFLYVSIGWKPKCKLKWLFIYCIVFNLFKGHRGAEITLVGHTLERLPVHHMTPDYFVVTFTLILWLWSVSKQLVCMFYECWRKPKYSLKEHKKSKKSTTVPGTTPATQWLC